MVIRGPGATITGGTAPGVMTTGIIPGATNPGVIVLIALDPVGTDVILAFTAGAAR